MVTVEQLALEHGVTTGEVRQAVGDHLLKRTDSGQSPLSDEQAQRVRDRFRGQVRSAEVWSLKVGDTVLRRELQQTYGGSRQAGIVTSTVTTDIIVFTDPVKGAKYGYDQFDGLHPDGSYTYTGAGQVGDQEMLRGNKALNEAEGDGRTIRLFVSKGPLVTYQGAYTTGEPRYTYESIPDTEGNLRRGIVFRFIPLGERGEDLPILGDTEDSSFEPLVTAWEPPATSDVDLATADANIVEDRVMTRVEHELQADFGQWLRQEGHTPKTLSLNTGAGYVKPDLYVPDLSWVVEAKKSTGRNYVRMAIGQVLDYSQLARRDGLEALPVILLPGLPDIDLQQLIASLGIALATRTREAFNIALPWAQTCEGNVIAEPS